MIVLDYFIFKVKERCCRLSGYVFISGEPVYLAIDYCFGWVKVSLCKSRESLGAL
jgi:hypothetical protein